MPPIVWLVLAIAAATAAYVVGWPAWQAYRARAAVDTNSERYLAWRGRAQRGPRVSPGMTPDERRRVGVGAALGVVAVLTLIGFFVGS